MLLAFQFLEADIGPHGLPMSETTDPENQFAYGGPDCPTMDWALKDKETRMDAYYKNNPRSDGHLWSVKKRLPKNDGDAL